MPKMRTPRAPVEAGAWLGLPSRTRAASQAKQAASLAITGRPCAAVWAAATGEGSYLLVIPLQGINDARQRFPRLNFMLVADPLVARHLLQEASRAVTGSGTTGP